MAMILDAFTSKFSELLVQMLQDEAVMLLGVPDEIRKLNKTLRYVRRFLADAENKKKESAIELWLRDLKDVMYDADDVMDLCQIKAQERLDSSDVPPSSNKDSSHPPSSSKLGCAFLDLFSCFRNPVFAHEIGTKIKEINSRLEEIAKRKADLGLLELPNASERRPVRRVDTFIHGTTDNMVVSEDIVGEKIEEDTGRLVSWLIEEEIQKVGVVAIVGLGGIGKTTLAKMVFNDPRIAEGGFQLKIWACVSKKVKGEEMLKSVIEQAGGDHGGSNGRTVLVGVLKGLVQGQRFLLVLDDVWEESKRVWSELLRAPLMAAAHGSRLLVTTRDERVAWGMGATRSHVHRVEKLSDEDGWSLLSKQVFHNEEQSEIQQFKDIGLELVKKCDGLPLAIKTIGSLLCKKDKTTREWQAVLTNAAWSTKELQENVHPAFYLSYEDLPWHLKLCFIICSLYPEDFKYLKVDLIYLWFGEGFLQDNGNLWEKGNECYRELLHRNLLENTGNMYDQAQCKMHDLLWSFACDLGKDENFILREGDSILKQEFSSKLRRLSVERHEAKAEEIIKEKGLRTILIDDIPSNGLDVLCSNLCSLRILDLSYSNITTLPDSLGDLKHLRYLDGSNSEISNVPESLGDLRNLAYLCFENCKELSDIPQSIINLKQLRFLSFVETEVEKIPTGVKNLENLIHLYGFKPDNDNSKGFSSLDELDALSQLTFLDLFGLERISEIDIVRRAKLGCKEKLQQLTLEYTPLSWEDQLSETNEKKVTAEGVLNELSPPSSLEVLEIKGYFGVCLPKWLNAGAAPPNLRYLYIRNCYCFKNLALLGQLPNLDWLKIKGAYSVEGVGEEFLKSGDSSIPVAFPKLIKLTFKRLSNWKEWKWNREVPAMPKLKKLYIEKCPQLRSLPEGLSHHAASLEGLQIINADNLSVIENLPTIKEIRVFRNPNLERISNLPRVSLIAIEKCPNLKAVEKLDDKSLQSMELYDDEMEVLPEYLVTLKPPKLKIHCSKQLLRKITTEGHEGEEGDLGEWHKFKHIAKVKINSWDGSLSATYQKKTPPSFAFTTNFTEIKL